VERAQCLLVATGGHDPASAEKLGDFCGKLAGDARRAKDEDVFARYKLCAAGER
jgi:hypothetical protein